MEPLIVYSRAWVDRPLARRKGVRLLPSRMLLGYLAKCPRRLSGEEIDAAHDQIVEALQEEQEHSLVRELWHVANEPALTVLAEVARRPVALPGSLPRRSESRGARSG